MKYCKWLLYGMLLLSMIASIIILSHNEERVIKKKEKLAK